jgi:hypothetical protein
VVEKSEESKKPVRATESKVATTRGADLFGGEFPNNSLGFREVKTKWMMVERRIEHSYISALARFGPMVRSRKAFVSKNGFRVCEFQCQVGKDCDYHARLYYPLGDEICHNFPSILEQTKNNKKRPPPTGAGESKEGRPLYKISDLHNDAVICQVLSSHTCSNPLSWSEHVLSKSKTGLHPSIKEAIEREADMDSHRLPKPTTMLCRIKELLSHDVDVLFPPDCLDIVSNQITDYWGRLRTKIHDSRSSR